MKSTHIVFLHSRGLVCSDLFRHWNNPENKKKSVEDHVSIIKKRTLFIYGAVFLFGLFMCFLGFATISPPNKQIILFFMFCGTGFISLAAVTNLWWDRRKRINDFASLDDFLYEHYTRYSLHLEYARISDLAGECLKKLGLDLRIAESDAGVDSPPARKARRKFKMAHHTFFTFGLVEKGQGKYAS